MARDDYFGVLVAVSITDSEGAIMDDLGYLFEVDRIGHDEAMRHYRSLNHTIWQHNELWLYLRKWIDKDQGLMLTYEVIDADGNYDQLEMYTLGHNLED